ncbi:MAG: GxxExxY protein [Planctomycetaceae bacterium]|nr:GxxExxY protein [Planctomycetaceae bacterium]
MKHEDLTREIIGAAIEVHRHLGPGLLESAYEKCLLRELAPRGLKYETQVPLRVSYKGEDLDCGYRLDVIVENLVVLELKSVSDVTDVHKAQLLTYLKLSAKPVGLLLNFNTEVMRHGILRMVM